MSADIYFYIQKKTDNGWAEIGLYNSDKDFVDIHRCGGEAWDYLKDHWHCHVDLKGVEKLASEHDWAFDDDDEVPYYCATLTKIKYLTIIHKYDVLNTPTEDRDIHQFFTDLFQEIRDYIGFAGDGLIDSDNIRVVALVSY